MESHGCIRFFNLMIIILVSLSAIHIATPKDTAEAQITPDVTVFVEPNILYIDVSPSGVGVATAMATFTNEGPHHVSCRMTIPIGNGSNYMPSPSQMNFAMTPFQVRTVQIAVVADLRSAHMQEVGAVVVTVKAVDFVPLDEYWVNDYPITVYTQPYIRLVVDADEPLVKSWPGKTKEIDFRIYNEGNVGDEVRIDIRNKEELYDKGFQVALESSGSTVVDPKDSVKMGVHVTTPGPSGRMNTTQLMSMRSHPSIMRYRMITVLPSGSEVSTSLDSILSRRSSPSSLWERCWCGRRTAPLNNGHEFQEYPHPRRFH